MAASIALRDEKVQEGPRDGRAMSCEFDEKHGVWAYSF